jgi:hypothetical protein
MRAAIAGRRMVFTLDRGFGDLARTVGTHAGVVVFRLPKQDAVSATEVVGRFVRQSISTSWAAARSSWSPTLSAGSLLDKLW